MPGLEDLLPALLQGDTAATDQLATAGGYQPGAASDLSLAGAVMKSPFYQGQASFSGAGQISEAVLPIVLGLLAGRAEEQQAKQEAAMTGLKTMLTVAQLQGATEDRQVRQLTGQAKLMEAMGKLQAASPEFQAEREAKAKSMGLEPSGLDEQGRPTFARPRKGNGLSEAIAQGFNQLGQTMGDTKYNRILDSFESAGYYPDPDTNAVRPYPTKQVFNTAMQKVVGYDALKKDFGRLRELTARNPEAFGLMGTASRTLQGVRAQRQAMFGKEAKSYLNSTTASIKREVAENGWDVGQPGDRFTYSRWFNPELNEIDTLKNMIAYKIARVNDDNGRLSDFDVQNALQSLEGQTWFQGMFSSNQSFMAGLNAAEASVRNSAQTASDVVASRGRALRSAMKMSGLPDAPVVLDFGGGPPASTEPTAQPTGIESPTVSLSLDPKSMTKQQAVQILQQKFGFTDPAVIMQKLNDAGF